MRELEVLEELVPVPDGMWSVNGEAIQDGIFIPIPADQYEIYRKQVQEDLDTAIEELKKPHTSYQPHAADFYRACLLANHWFISVTIPELDEGDTEEDRANYTWWDFSVIPVALVDGKWYICGELDPGDTGGVWYQQCYTKESAYQYRELAIEWAKAGKLYNEFVREDYDNLFYDTQLFYEECKAQFGE